MPVMYDPATGFIIAPNHCEDCGEPLYDTGCDAPGCRGFSCPDCGTGCDRDFPDGRCASALKSESGEEYTARINAERAAFGLKPLTGEG